ncbi:MAG: SH3 domain-containing protein [Chloroflexi bacterium]|nr:SH3 domain-containing protein [Chloroflexota bacterium]
MKIKQKNWLIAMMMIALTALACNLPGVAPPAGTNTATDTPSPTLIAETTSTPTATGAGEACTPTVTATTLANVRLGPGQEYAVLGNLPQGGSAKVAGRNAENTWWYIEFAGGENGYAWISTTVTTSACIPATLAIIVPPPAPATSTPEPTEVVNNPAPNASATPTTFSIFVPPGGFQIIPSPTPTFFIIFPLPIPIITP